MGQMDIWVTTWRSWPIRPCRFSGSLSCYLNLLKSKMLGRSGMKVWEGEPVIDGGKGRHVIVSSCPVPVHRIVESGHWEAGKPTVSWDANHALHFGAQSRVLLLFSWTYCKPCHWKVVWNVSGFSAYLIREVEECILAFGENCSLCKDKSQFLEGAKMKVEVPEGQMVK